MSAPLAAAWGFALVLLRTSGLVMSAPILSARFVPARIRLGLALAIAFAVWQGAGAPEVAPPAGLAALAAAAAAEGTIGIVGGLGARWALEAALGAGNLAGLSGGLGFGALVDPASGAESGAIPELLSVLAQGAAIAAGLHREAIAWLARGVVAWPPGGALPLSELATRAIGQGTLSIAIAVRMAFPILAATVLGHVLTSLLGRLAPQLSLQNVGFSIAVLGGGLALYLSAPAAAEMAARAAAMAFQG